MSAANTLQATREPNVTQESATTKQESLSTWIERLEKAGLLRRFTQELRVDELPQIMEDKPNKAVLVEHVKDCAFPFLANAYATAEMYALALGCDTKSVATEASKRMVCHYPAELVETAPCKDVILKGDDVDLSIFPLFAYHPFDGQAYLDDTRVISRNPDTGILNDGIQRFMYRSKNETNVDMRAAQHGGAENAKRYQELGKDMPIAVCIGGPTLDKLSSMLRLPGSGIDGWDKLGGFVGGPAKVVKCETNDLTVPVNAEIVLEGRVMTSEGMIHDEGSFGEFTGTYGSTELPHNPRVIIDCITYRKGATYQVATIGGMHPGMTDCYAFQPAVEGEIIHLLQRAEIQVKDVHCPPAGGGAIAYASIKARSGGDAMQTLGIMLSGSRQYMPKIAYVFDEDIDIYDDVRVKWAQAWRYNPGHGNLIMPRQNMIPLDPSMQQLHPPYSVDKIGFDCVIPLDADRSAYAVAVASDPIQQPTKVTDMSEQAIAAEMESLIVEKPRGWRELLVHFAGQPYPAVYRAFGSLRHNLGRITDDGPIYPYTPKISESDLVSGTKSDKRHSAAKEQL